MVVPPRAAPVAGAAPHVLHEHETADREEVGGLVREPGRAPEQVLRLGQHGADAEVEEHAAGHGRRGGAERRVRAQRRGGQRRHPAREAHRQEPHEAQQLGLCERHLLPVVMESMLIMVMVMVMVMASAVRGAWEKMARASSEKRRSEKRRAVELTTCASSAASDSPFANLHLPPLRGDVQHVVPPDHAVAVLGLELPVDVLLRLLHRDVHEPIQTREDASVVHPGVELDHDGAP
mmetsp:Transcript_27874/g.88597  ORF Transcript_27874/g.88597 Transcript_27874/m.88597 type:complete len:235 (-) Transcript_27874:138-842(-)